MKKVVSAGLVVVASLAWGQSFPSHAYEPSYDLRLWVEKTIPFYNPEAAGCYGESRNSHSPLIGPLNRPDECVLLHSSAENYLHFEGDVRLLKGAGGKSFHLLFGAKAPLDGGDVSPTLGIRFVGSR